MEVGTSETSHHQNQPGSRIHNMKPVITICFILNNGWRTNRGTEEQIGKKISRTLINHHYRLRRETPYFRKILRYKICYYKMMKSSYIILFFFQPSEYHKFAFYRFFFWQGIIWTDELLRNKIRLKMIYHPYNHLPGYCECSNFLA